MSAAAWTIVGVFVGAVLPFLAAVWTEHRASRRAAADRDERRESRLFAARRAAFEDFMSRARLAIDAAWAGKFERPQTATLTEVLAVDDAVLRLLRDHTDGLTRALEAVRLYASDATIAAAEALHEGVEQYAFESDPADAPSPEANHDAYAWASGLITAFASAARTDLAR